MTYFTGLLIVIFILYLVINPLFSGNKKWDSAEIKDDLDEITKEQLFVAINELEMEYNMGKIAKKDFEKLKDQYHALAIKQVKEESKNNNLKVEEQLEQSAGEVFQVEQDIEREIEEELSRLRRKRGIGK